MTQAERIAIYCVGNKLMLDDGLGPAVFNELALYDFPPQIEVFDLGCLTLDRINDVRDFGLIITVDAVDGTGQAPGTIFRYAPDDMAKRTFGTQSLHDLKLSDLFNAAVLLDYHCEGVCFGMQVENASPAEAVIGLSASVARHLGDLVDCVLAELVNRGLAVYQRDTGEQVVPGYHHVCDEASSEPR